MTYLFTVYIFATIVFLWMAGFTAGYFVALYYSRGETRHCYNCNWLKDMPFDDQYPTIRKICGLSEKGIYCRNDYSHWKRISIWKRIKNQLKKQQREL